MVSVTSVNRVCPDCNGTGWKILHQDEVSGAERCHCAFDGRAERNITAAGIPPLYTDKSFENFKNKPSPGEYATIQTYLKRFIGDFPAQDRPGLLFLGDPGTGKTHLAIAVFRELLKRGFEGVFFDYQNLLDRIRESFNNNAGLSDREVYRSAMDAEILMLDDLGAHRVTEFAEDTVTAILTHRCNHRRPLIATTNLTDPSVRQAAERQVHRKELAQVLGERARSRLFEMCRFVRMPTLRDYREDTGIRL